MKSIIGNILCVLALFFICSFYGCRTSKSSLFKESISIDKSDIKINKIDSVADIVRDLQSKEFNSKNLFEVSNDFDFTFNGQNNEDLFEVIKTDNGYQFKGKGSATYKGSETKKKLTKSTENSSFENSLSNIKSNSKLEHLSKENQSKTDKSKINKSTGFNLNFTILLIIIGSVALVLLWKFGFPKVKNK